MRSADWKRFYGDERRAMGERGLLALLDSAPPLALPSRGALVFPHARLSSCGAQVASAARAVIESGCDEVIALGVLHGGRDAGASRRVHGPGTEQDEEKWVEEFSLDGFVALLALAAKRVGRAAPRVHARFPFLVGKTPGDLPGLDELRALRSRGAALVGTADHVHHGPAYGTKPEARLARTDSAACIHARTGIEASMELLRARNVAGFLRLCGDLRSDFRDPGPVLATLLDEAAPRPGAWEGRVASLELCAYDDVLGDEGWVAAALVTCELDLAPLPSPPLGRCG